jgi:leucyl aminopeptidase
MKFHVDTNPTATALRRLDAFLLPVWLDKKGKVGLMGDLFAQLDSLDQKLIKNFLASRPIKAGETRLFRLNKAPDYVLLAIESEFSEKKLSLLVRRFVRMAKAEGFKLIGLYTDDFETNNIAAQRAAALLAENTLLAHYDFSEVYKTAPKEGWKQVESFVVFTHHEAKTMNAAIQGGELIAESVNQCRSLANFPPSDLKPEGMAEAARTVANQVGAAMKVTVFDEKKLKQEGMNAILAVGQGSASGPRLIIMEYSGNKKVTRADLALIGKGVTFDSGGLNIKPGDHMADMHMDMSGGAAVIYAMQAIAKLKLPINVVGLVPAVENMPSGLSYRQGDIVKAYGGKTIEIGNTDAEGRVILADAIEYAKIKKPTLMVEISTLTGAAEVALGQRVAALFVKNNKPLADVLQGLGDASGDYVWPMPLWEEHERDIEGNLADTINTHKTGSRWGGAITGAAFLSKFAGETPFAHIDMAPRMLTLPDEEQLSRGAAGFGVRLFVELAKQWSNVEKLVK